MKLVVGLGNPERKYKDTRHNAGFRVVDMFSRVSGIELRRSKHFSLFGKGKIGRESVILAKPLTYVNLTGTAVKSFVRYYEISLRDLLIVYDDMDLSIGKIRIRPDGGSGGHRGVQSIISHLGSEKFPRIRIGIGRKEDKRGSEFVLGKFSAEEKPVIEEAAAEVVKAIEVILREGLTLAMNRFNQGTKAQSGKGT